MIIGRHLLLTMAIVALAGCSAQKTADDRTIIESIADDVEVGVRSGDLMKLQTHMSAQARRLGYEANRFMMESSYGPSISTEFTARSIKVMGDSAHLAFVVMPAGMEFSDSLHRSVVRLIRADTWKIASFHLVRNREQVEADSLPPQ